MSKTRAIRELRRVIRRLVAYPMLNSCTTPGQCGGKKKASAKCVFCDSAHVMKYSERLIL